MTTCCEKCGQPTLNKDLIMVQVGRQTHSSPAEYEAWCRECSPQSDIDYDEAYERAAQRYDGSGRDWR